jgi:hypothetical protein
MGWQVRGSLPMRAQVRKKIRVVNKNLYYIICGNSSIPKEISAFAATTEKSAFVDSFLSEVFFRQEILASWQIATGNTAPQICTAMANYNSAQAYVFKCRVSFLIPAHSLTPTPPNQ